MGGSGKRNIREGGGRVVGRGKRVMTGPVDR